MRPTLRLLLIGLLGLCLAGCAHHAAEPGQPVQLLHDDLYGPPQERIDPAEVFALNDAMRRYASEELAATAQRRDPRRALIDALYSPKHLGLNYDAVRTRNAAEAFEARAGNCLSLVIMTAAFAKHLGLPVSYQRVEVDELYTRDNNLTFASGHVNLVMQRLVTRSLVGRTDAEDLTIDFLPASELHGQRTHPLSEATVVAMYLNNRAAEALAQGRLDDAYAWARAAVRQDPGFHAAVNTLAVVYLRSGHVRESEAALRVVLAAESDNAAALSNLVILLQRIGRTAEAQQAAVRLADVQPVPPFHHFELGRRAMEAGDWAAARDHFARELKRQPHQHEVHFWMAQAYWRMGNVRHATEHMAKARDFSTTMATHSLYSAKLDRLRELRMQ